MIPIMRVATGAFKQFMIKRPAAKASPGDLARKLEAAGATLERRYGATTDSEANRERLRHVIGIERWGQRRLEAFAGKEPPTDESDGYLPSANASWRDLKLAFANTRRNTVALARQLADAQITDERRVPHNQLGPLTAREWLHYLRQHADFESRRLK